MDVISYRPEPHELAWTFGGVPPVRRVKPGTVLELWSEDAFAGKVRGVDDLVSQVIEFPFVNPLTGPVPHRGRRARRHAGGALRLDRAVP